MNRSKVRLSDLNLSRRACIRGVTRFSSVALGLVLVFGSTVAFASTGLYDQTGKQTSTTNVDGATVVITPYSFSPGNVQCVIYAVLLPDWSSSLQLETGLLTCNNQTFDSGACTSGHAFSESFDGVNYHCGQGSTFTMGSANTALIERSSGTTTMWGATDGSYISQTGFGATDSIQSLAWGEAATGSACPSSPHSAAFTGWKKFLNATGWSYVTSASLYHGWQQFPTSPCWTVGSLSSTGDFNVS